MVFYLFSTSFGFSICHGILKYSSSYWISSEWESWRMKINSYMRFFLCREIAIANVHTFCCCWMLVGCIDFAIDFVVIKCDGEMWSHNSIANDLFLFCDYFWSHLQTNHFSIFFFLMNWCCIHSKCLYHYNTHTYAHTMLFKMLNKCKNSPLPINLQDTI